MDYDARERAAAAEEAARVKPFRFEDLDGKPEPERWGPTYPKTANAAVLKWRATSRTRQLSADEARAYSEAISEWIGALNAPKQHPNTFSERATNAPSGQPFEFDCAKHRAKLRAEFAADAERDKREWALGRSLDRDGRTIGLAYAAAMALKRDPKAAAAAAKAEAKNEKARALFALRLAKRPKPKPHHIVSEAEIVARKAARAVPLYDAEGASFQPEYGPGRGAPDLAARRSEAARKAWATRLASSGAAPKPPRPAPTTDADKLARRKEAARKAWETMRARKTGPAFVTATATATATRLGATIKESGRDYGATEQTEKRERIKKPPTPFERGVARSRGKSKGERQAEIAAALAEKRQAKMATLPGTMAEALPLYRDMIARHHELMVAAKGEEAIEIRKDAHLLAVKVNGGEPGICAGPDAPGSALDRKTAAPVGSVPLWGQAGDFVIDVDGMKVRVTVDGMFGIGSSFSATPAFETHVVERDRPFLSETGYRSFMSMGTSALLTPGLTVDQFVRLAIAAHVRGELKGKLKPLDPHWPRAAQPQPKAGLNQRRKTKCETTTTTRRASSRT